MNTFSNLANLRILNTRPLEQGKDLSLAISAAGGIAIDLPMLKIEPVDLPFLPNLYLMEKAIFISPNAVAACTALLEKNTLIWPKTLEVLAIGKATAQTLEKVGIKVHDFPVIADSEHLLALSSLQEVTNKNILLVKGEGGRALIEEELSARGANLTLMSIYKRVMPPDLEKTASFIWRNDAVDIILLTSEQAMNNLFTVFHGKAAQNWLCNKPCMVVSERLAKKAAFWGFKTIVVRSIETLNK